MLKHKFFSENQLKNYAKVMVWALEDTRRSTGKGAVYVPGDVIVLRYEPSSEVLAQYVYPLLLKSGFNVVLKPGSHYSMKKIFFDNAEESQLKFVGSWDKELARNAKGLVALHAPDSLTHLKDCDPNKMAMSSLASKEIRNIIDEQEFAGKFGWTLSIMPTSALAKQAQMSEQEYADEIAKACYLNEEDPIAKWIDTTNKIDKIKNWLTDMPIEYVHVVSDDGETNLKVWIGEHRQWLGGSGHNIPSFEVFVSPEAGHAEGKYRANESSFKMGRYVKDVRLRFSNGIVMETTAKQEEEFVRSRVNLDSGSKMIGEFSLTDKRFSQITKFMANILFDENVGGKNGNCHIAIGKAYPESYAGKEKMTPELAKKMRFSESAEHWDLVNTSPKIVTAYLKDGSNTVIYKNGSFTFEG